MGARDRTPSLSINKRDALERQNRALLRALQQSQQVVYEGRSCRIDALHFLTAGGATEVDVRLDGRPAPVGPDGILIVDAAGHGAASAELDQEHEHNRVLLHALQIAHRVRHQGRFRFIHALTFSADGASTKAIVYLTGSAEPISPAEVALAPRTT